MPKEGMVKRRDFLTKGTVAAGLASSTKLLPPLAAAQSSAPKPAQAAAKTPVAQEEIRSVEYLQRAKRDKFLPKPPAFRESYGPADVPVSPMPLAERIKRKIVPRRGFCSIAPGASLSEGLTSGNGAMNIEMTGDPYAEQIQHTIAQLVPLIQPGDWRLGWQSKGLRGGDWLDPSAEEMVQEFAAAGWNKLLVAPVGFVSDTVETLFDLDIELRRTIEESGMRFVRSQPPNDSPTFIAALAGFVTDYLAQRSVTTFLDAHSGPLDAIDADFETW